MSYRNSGGYRGGYRGSRGGGDSYRGRGGYSGSSRFNHHSPPHSSHSNFDSRSNRPSFRGSERYSGGRGIGSDDSFRRPYRAESPVSYRDSYRSRAMSPEPPRKRIREESPYSNALARRSHERNFSNEYSGRSYFGDKGSSYSGNQEKTYREVREVRSSEFSIRRPISARSPRGRDFRGKFSTRGRGRGSLRAAIFAKKRFLADSYGVRKRLSRNDLVLRRQLRLNRLRRERLERAKGSDDDEPDEEEDKDDEDVDQEEDEVGQSSGEEEAAGEKNEKDESGDKKVETKEAAKTTDADKKPDSTKLEPQAKKGSTSPEKKVKKSAKTENKDDDKTESSDKKDDAKPLLNFLGQPYIKLKCPHCSYSCVTFQEYGYHLSTKKHQLAMRSLALKLRQKISDMRNEQRKKQKQLDEEANNSDGRLRSSFCPICKLNYKTLKSEHRLSASHMKMREFLLPFCKVCRLTYKSPMLYEAHLCDLAHIKRKARLERLRAPAKEEEIDGDSIDTNDFMVLDAVGSESDDEKPDVTEEKQDGKGESESGGSAKKDKDKTKDSGEKSEDSKKKAEIGSEFIKAVEAHWCDLCLTFLPLSDDKPKAIRFHCRTRMHLQRYVRNKDTARRKARAEKAKEIRKRGQEKVKKSSDKTPVKEETKEKETEENDVKPAANKSESVVDVETSDLTDSQLTKKKNDDQNIDADDKIWSEVDKDLTNLLNSAEEEVNKFSDEEDEEDSRTDGGRFKFSEASEDGTLTTDPNSATDASAKEVKSSA